MRVCIYNKLFGQRLTLSSRRSGHQAIWGARSSTTQIKTKALHDKHVAAQVIQTEDQATSSISFET